MTGAELERLLGLFAPSTFDNYLWDLKDGNYQHGPDEVALVARWFAGERYESTVPPLVVPTPPPPPQPQPLVEILREPVRSGPLELKGDFDGVTLP